MGATAYIGDGRCAVALSKRLPNMELTAELVLEKHHRARPQSRGAWGSSKKTQEKP
jgi:hypothetical protein